VPREVKAYGCEYRCGRKFTTSKAHMEAHEKVCWSNPGMRTCRTCGNERDGEGLYRGVRWCAKSLLFINAPSNPIAIGCAKWEGR